MNLSPRIHRQRLIVLGSCFLLLAQSLASAQAVRARISFKVILDANGNPPPDGSFYPPDHIEGRTFRANEHLAANGADWRLEVVEIVEVPGISQFYAPTDTCPAVRREIETAAMADPTTYHWREDAINVYVLQHPDGCAVCARVLGGENIIISNVQDDPPNHLEYVLIHEVGHYFDLCHTQGCFCASCGSGGCPTQPADADDEVNDTLPDSPCWDRADIAIYNFGVNYGDLGSENQRRVDATYGNLMSYHLDDGNVLTVFTPGQLRKMVAEMHPVSGRRRAVISREPVDCNQNGIPDDLDLVSGASLDCNRDAIPDECNVAAGASLDCNHNLVPDSCEPDCNQNGQADGCDIASGTSSDCNSSGVPDECEPPDCNRNRLPDDCDLASGRSPDCNANGIPDECDLLPTGVGFGEPTALFAGAVPTGAIYIDWNGDGRPDLVTTSNGTDTLRVHRGDENASQVFLAEHPAGGDGPRAPAAADLDLDGDLDLVLAHAGSGLRPGSTVGVLLGDDQGMFSPPSVLPVGRGPVDLALADLNGDGQPDIAAACSRQEQVSVMLNLGLAGGTFAFAAATSHAAGNGPSAVLAAQFDGVETIDLLVANVGSLDVSVLQGDGAGGFLADDAISLDLSPLGLEAADLNRDGRLDLVTADRNADGWISVFMRRQDGGFEERRDLSLPSGPTLRRPTDILVADLGGDGAPDILALSSDLLSVSLLENRRDGTFDPASLLRHDPAVEASRLIAADVDGDSDLDIGVLSSTNDSLYTLLNVLVLPASLDCNRNAVPDGCDVAGGSSPDGDSDGVPDECSPPPPAPPAFTGPGFSPTEGPVGARILLLGIGFTGATSVSFNGVDAVFVVHSDVSIEGTVPSGASTGPITLVTPAGSVTSANVFAVLPLFRRGDANADGVVDLSDAIATLTFLFSGGAELPCLDAADANDSGLADISDAVYTLGFLFLGAATPPQPFPDCGADGTEDDLTCEASGHCAGS